MKNIVCYEIKTLDNLIERLLIKKCKNEERIITPIQIHILKFLIENSEVYQRDLEKKLKFRRSTSLGILKTMEKNGLITRLNSTDNSRLKKIIITEKGLKKAKLIKDDMNKFESMLTKNIDKKDLDLFFNVIKNIKKNIKQEEEND